MSETQIRLLSRTIGGRCWKYYVLNIWIDIGLTCSKIQRVVQKPCQPQRVFLSLTCMSGPRLWAYHYDYQVSLNLLIRVSFIETRTVYQICLVCQPQEDKFFKDVEDFYSDTFCALYECRLAFKSPHIRNRSFRNFCVDFIGFRHEVNCFREFWEAKNDQVFNQMIEQGTEAGARIFVTQMTILYESFEQDFEQLLTFVEKCREYAYRGEEYKHSILECCVTNNTQDTLIELRTGALRNIVRGSILHDHLSTVRCFYERQEQKKFIHKYLSPLIRSLDRAVIELGTGAQYPIHHPEIRQVNQVEQQNIQKILDHIIEIEELEIRLAEVREVQDLGAALRLRIEGELRTQRENKYDKLDELQKIHHGMFPYECNYAARCSVYSVIRTNFFRHPIVSSRTQKDLLLIPGSCIRTIRTRASASAEAEAEALVVSVRSEDVQLVQSGSSGLLQNRMIQMSPRPPARRSVSRPSISPTNGPSSSPMDQARSLQGLLEDAHRLVQSRTASSDRIQSEGDRNEQNRTQNRHRRPRHILQLPTPSTSPSTTPPASPRASIPGVSPLLTPPASSSSSSSSSGSSRSSSRPRLRIDTVAANRYGSAPNNTSLIETSIRPRTLLPPYYPITALPVAQQEVLRRVGYTQLSGQEPQLPQTQASSQRGSRALNLDQTRHDEPREPFHTGSSSIGRVIGQQFRWQDNERGLDGLPRSTWESMEGMAMVGRRMTQRDIRQINSNEPRTVERHREIRTTSTSIIRNNAVNRRVSSTVDGRSIIEVVEIEDVETYAEQSE